MQTVEESKTVTNNSSIDKENCEDSIGIKKEQLSSNGSSTAGAGLQMRD